MFGGIPAAGQQNQRFQATFRCYPVSFAQTQRDVEVLEKGDKILLPPSVLDTLARLNVTYPLMFEIKNPAFADKPLHCGVLEFIAEEGVVHIPYWMMQNLQLTEGSLLELKSATIPKGKFVKFRPQSSDFTEMSNPRAVLESTLRHFSALTTGEVVRIHFGSKQYDIDVVEVQARYPSPDDTSGGTAISIIETDVEVDFAPPSDSQESSTPAAAAAGPVAESSSEEESGDEVHTDDEEPKFSAFSAEGKRLDGKDLKAKRASRVSNSPNRPTSSASSSSETKPFVAFSGQGNKLK